jgi:acyl carrier protein
MDEKLRKIISTVLLLPESQIGPELDSDQVDRWDSLGHLELILAIEREFGLRFRAEDIPRLKSVAELERTLRALAPHSLDEQKPERLPK